MKDTEKLNKALEKALSERYEVSIKETMEFTKGELENA